jgi:hypothetical protein
VKITATSATRLAFLVRVAERASLQLLDTDRRLFSDLFSLQVAEQLESDPILAERVDAFVSRFGRL